MQEAGWQRWFARDTRTYWATVVLWGVVGAVRAFADGWTWWVAIQLALSAAVFTQLAFRVPRPRPARPRKITDAQVREVLKRSGGHLPNQGGPPR